MIPEDPEDTYGGDDDSSDTEDTHSDDWNNDFDEEEARYGDDRDD